MGFKTSITYTEPGDTRNQVVKWHQFLITINSNKDEDEVISKQEFQFIIDEFGDNLSQYLLVPNGSILSVEDADMEVAIEKDGKGKMHAHLYLRVRAQVKTVFINLPKTRDYLNATIIPPDSDDKIYFNVKIINNGNFNLKTYLRKNSI